MDIEYRINRGFLLFFTGFVILLSYFAIVDNYLIEKKIIHLVISFAFLYATYVMYFFRIRLTDESIKNIIFFFPFYKKERECKFEDIDKITYDFLVLEEIGSFKIYPKPFNVDKMIIVNFLVNNKKEIIEKILEKRPDLKIDNWARENILNYKIIRRKSLIVIVVVLIIILWLQMKFGG